MPNEPQTKLVTVYWSTIVHFKNTIKVPCDEEDTDRILERAQMLDPRITGSEIERDSEVIIDVEVPDAE